MAPDRLALGLAWTGHRSAEPDVGRLEGSHPRLIWRLQTAVMSVVMRAILSMTVAVGAGVAVATVASTLADVLGGIVALAAMLVFTRTIMNLAAAPGEEPQRPDGPC
jgi:hypothetical protein